MKESPGHSCVKRCEQNKSTRGQTRVRRAEGEVSMRTISKISVDRSFSNTLTRAPISVQSIPQQITQSWMMLTKKRFKKREIKESDERTAKERTRRKPERKHCQPLWKSTKIKEVRRGQRNKRISFMKIPVRLSLALKITETSRKEYEERKPKKMKLKSQYIIENE